MFQNLQNGDEVVLVTRSRPDGLVKTLHAGTFPAEGAQERNAYPALKDALRVEKNGEEVTIVECFLPPPRLIIFGGGHIAVPLSLMGAMLKFDVTVFDDRPSFAGRTRFPGAAEVICDSFERVAERLTIRKNDYVVIVTRGHRHDQECLRAVLNGEIPRYMGMIGSRRRAAIVRRQMAEEGYAPLMERLHSPIGLPIGAVTPEEIAVSILAEVLQEKRRNPGDLDAGASRDDGKRYADMDVLQWLARAEENGGEGENVAIVTVLSTRGSTPREAGAKMVVLRDGRAVGSIGGGCAEADVTRDAREILRSGGHCFKTVDLTDSAEDDGMMCGGVMEVLIEAVQTGKASA
ncbi:MAG: XdhC family protein [Synergistaceae bacterium]|nr:XdhC family protein [Synergistaceae bacterium]